MKVRQSNFELLRIICILMIVSMHIWGEIFHTHNTLNRGLIVFLNSFCNTGVTLFMLISGYFGIQFNLYKLFKLICITSFYSLLTFGIYALYFNDTFNIVEKISYIVPLLGSRYWFISAYVVIFSLSSFLNSLIKVLTKKEYELLLFILGFFFILSPTFLLIEIQDDLGKGVINLGFSYLVGQYLKVYGFPLFIQKNSGKILFTCIFLIVVLNTILTKYTGNITLRFSRDNNLFILIESISIFYLCFARSFYSMKINQLARYVFPIYLFHNVQIRLILEKYSFYSESNLFILIYLGMLFFIFFTCVVIEIVRNNLFNKMENIAFNKLSTLYYSRS